MLYKHAKFVTMELIIMYRNCNNLKTISQLEIMLLGHRSLGHTKSSTFKYTGYLKVQDLVLWGKLEKGHPAVT